VAEEPNAGRPKKDDAREKIVRVRVNDRELALLKEAADIQGLELSTWARMELLGLARKVLSRP
jgi:uncharacterized protein (DUF1778 family)